ncbi:unnamed protein product [Lasius platythorax]|uniref:Uncharacterized protein n=1 Tax=Lasius platythorax TaxID=488582 RepID=A0AAV2NP59_9HYME
MVSVIIVKRHNNSDVKGNESPASRGIPRTSFYWPLRRTLAYMQMNGDTTQLGLHIHFAFHVERDATGLGVDIDSTRSRRSRSD